MKRQWSILATVTVMCVALMMATAVAYAQLGTRQGKVVDETGSCPDAEAISR